MIAERVFIGLYSGPAADGVDAALVAVKGGRERPKVRTDAHLHAPFEQSLRQAILDASVGRPGGGSWPSPAELAALDARLGEAFANAAVEVVKKAGVEMKSVAAIGWSGQVIGQAEPDGGRPGSAVELGQHGIISLMTSRPVIADMLRDHLAGGRTGSPTDTAAWRLLRDKRLSRVLVHLGGLARVTFIGADSHESDVVAFDAGPCGLVLDALAVKLLQRPVDADGAAAAQGKPCGEFLDELLSHPYFRRAAPMLADMSDWGPVYIERLGLMARKHGCEDKPATILATVVEMIARSIAGAIAGLTERPHEVILSGGGALHIRLAGRIRALMSPSSTVSVEKFGLPLRATQAAFVAMLAHGRLRRH
ncbi:MAG: anhydro-N-acetylmuramic acid kinase [Phycisphaerae bacterium]